MSLSHEYPSQRENAVMSLEPMSTPRLCHLMACLFHLPETPPIPYNTEVQCGAIDITHLSKNVDRITGSK